jgi:hypothetical protein
MAKKQPARPARAEKRREERQKTKQRIGREERLEKNAKRNYTLLDCMKFGKIANILFVLFIILCLIYYYSLASKGHFSVIFELVVYVVETCGFALFTVSVVWLDRLVRARQPRLRDGAVSASAGNGGDRGEPCASRYFRAYRYFRIRV